jgi:ABC-type ATPase with predicted acetyltransferase domain
LVFEQKTDVTERTADIRAAFGVSPEGYENVVLRNFDFEIPPRSVVLLCGISGSGKTSVLSLIKGALKATRGQVILSDNAKIAELVSITEDRALIELVGSNLQDALYALNKVGLAEAKLYLKPYSQLSSGQKYRASVARLVDSDANIWIADEFCSSLDKLTANIVACSVQRHVRRNGITFIAACANPQAYVKALNPDYIVELQAERAIIRRREQNV